MFELSAFLRLCAHRPIRLYLSQFIQTQHRAPIGSRSLHHFYPLTAPRQAPGTALMLKRGAPADHLCLVHFAALSVEYRDGGWEEPCGKRSQGYVTLRTRPAPAMAASHEHRTTPPLHSHSQETQTLLLFGLAARTHAVSLLLLLLKYSWVYSLCPV